MPDDLRTRIAAALSAHIERQLTNCDTGSEECGCGRQGSATYREHLADAILALPGIAVVELPEPDAELPHPLWALVFDDIHADDGQVVTHTPGGVYRSVEAPKQARKRAAALLAAAEHAEREQ